MLLYIDGFDHYHSQTDAGLKGWLFSTTGGTVSWETGRLNGSAFVLGGGVPAVRLLMYQVVAPSTDTVTVGVAFKLTSDASQIGTQLYHVIELFSSTGTVIGYAMVNGSGTIDIYDSTLAVKGTTTQRIFLDTWCYFELKITKGAAGAFATQMNGVADVSGTGNWTGNRVGRVGFRADGSDNGASTGLSYIVGWDDLYILDSSGAANNTFLGDQHIETLYPNAAGNYSQFTPSAGSNYQNVDEHPKDDDTTYNADGTVGHIDTYNMDNLSVASATIAGVQINNLLRKDEATTRLAARAHRHSGADDFGSDLTLTTSYLDYHELFETNPATAAAWTVSDVNADEWGVKVTL